MALPDALSTGTVTGHWVTSDGDPARGWVTFTPRASALISPTDETVVLPTPRVAQLVDGHLYDMGSPGIALPATDDPNITPIGWSWKVETNIEGADNRAFDILLPAGTTVDLSSVIEVTADGGTVQVISGSSVTASDEEPENPAEGDLWWDITAGALFVRVDDAWVETTPEAPVVSVNGKTGAVVLDAGDVGAARHGDLAEVAFTGDYADLTGAPDTPAFTAPLGSAATNWWVSQPGPYVNENGGINGVGRAAWTACLLSPGEWDAIAIWVTTTATATWRLCIDSVGPDGAPGELLVDAGTIDMSTASTTELTALVLPEPLVVDRPTWVWGRCQVDAFTAPNPRVSCLNAANGNHWPHWLPTGAGYSNRAAAGLLGVNHQGPDQQPTPPPTGWTLQSSTAPRVYIRRAT